MSYQLLAMIFHYLSTYRIITPCLFKKGVGVKTEGRENHWTNIFSVEMVFGNEVEGRCERGDGKLGLG